MGQLWLLTRLLGKFLTARKLRHRQLKRSLLTMLKAFHRKCLAEETALMKRLTELGRVRLVKKSLHLWKIAVTGSKEVMSEFHVILAIFYI